MKISDHPPKIETRDSGEPFRSKKRRPLALRTRAHGFTLLEILVATAVMGTAVAALFSLLSGALGNASRLQAPSRALLLGQSRMNELLSAGIDTGLGTLMAMPLDQKLQGRWDDQYRWEAQATRWNAPPDTAPGQPVLVRIALDVFWKTQPGKLEKKLSLETFQLRPEPPRSVQ
jgi:general secretion pathway protein I